MCRKASLCKNIYRSYVLGDNLDFWGSLDNLVLSLKLGIDRPRALVSGYHIRFGAYMFGA
jgi:hypothetical protein